MILLSGRMRPHGKKNLRPASEIGMRRPKIVDAAGVQEDETLYKAWLPLEIVVVDEQQRVQCSQRRAVVLVQSPVSGAGRQILMVSSKVTRECTSSGYSFFNLFTNTKIVHKNDKSQNKRSHAESLTH